MPEKLPRSPSRRSTRNIVNLEGGERTAQPRSTSKGETLPSLRVTSTHAALKQWPYLEMFGNIPCLTQRASGITSK